MDSRKLLPAIGIVIWSAVALTAAPRALSHRHSIELTRHGDSPIASCSDLDTRFDNRRAIVQSEERTITKAEASTLRIQAESNGGLQVEGWNNFNYGVTLVQNGGARQRRRNCALQDSSHLSEWRTRRRGTCFA